MAPFLEGSKERLPRRLSLFVSALGLISRVVGQLDVPGPVVLDGAAPEQRQVLGLAAPQTSDAAVSAGDLRSITVSRADAVGTAILIADLFPAPAGYSAGMVVQITPAEANATGAQIDLNGLGPRALMKWGGIPLDSADLQPGVPVRFVYDGAGFLLLGDTRLNCPAGYLIAASDYCIEAGSRTALDFFDANLQCSSVGGRLCTLGEWTQACGRFPDFMATVLDIEWIDNAANNANYAKVMGIGEDGSGGTGTGCTYGGLRLPTLPNRFRCCMNR